MNHILDRPVWNALETRHAHLAAGGDLAKRYATGMVPFAAARDDSAESIAALSELAAPDEMLIFLQSDEILLPPGHVAEITAQGVQMIAERWFPTFTDERVEPLGEADAAEMLALATLTKPGPFSLKSQNLGQFWGVRRDGRLVAMAGQRFRHPGISELSGVCTHPDARGEGLGRLLSLYVAGQICATGDQPYLHAYATNATAIALYESIGFRLRSIMHVAMARRIEAAHAA